VTWEIRQGDVCDRLREMPDESVQCVVTSPPYWGLRDYGDDGQLGLEPNPEQYVANLVEVFREVGRVLRDDGTLWLNLGDSYAGSGKGPSNDYPRGAEHLSNVLSVPNRWLTVPAGLKGKDLVGIPWMVAFALRADGWWLRSDIVWSKPNPMPESVTDRPTRAHEYLFLLTKSARYYYDAEAVRERDTGQDHARQVLDGQPSLEPSNGLASPHRGLRTLAGRDGLGRNRRSVWEIATEPYPEAHFATFPTKLVEPCILAGSSPKACGECGVPWERVAERAGGSFHDHGADAVQGQSQDGARRKQRYRDSWHPPMTLGWAPGCEHEDDRGSSTVLDPFAGSGTVGVVALRHDRDFIGIELSEEYCELARRRIVDDAPLLNAGGGQV
jgi:DNA modification methylase